MKWSGDRQPSRERIQNSDSEGDPGSREKSGGKDWDDARNVYQRPRRTKEQTEMNNTLEGINTRITEAEEQINDLEDKMVGITATEQNIDKRMKRNEDSLRGPWDNIKCTNVRIIGIPEGEERVKGPEKIFEVIINEKSPNIGKEIVNQVQEAQRIPGRINPSSWYRVICDTVI